MLSQTVEKGRTVHQLNGLNIIIVSIVWPGYFVLLLRRCFIWMVEIEFVIALSQLK